MFSMLDWKIWVKELNDASHNNHKVNRKTIPLFLKTVKLQIASVNEDVEKLEPLCIAGLNAKWFSCCGNTLAVPQEVKHRITIWPSKSTLRYIYKRTEHSNKSLYSHVYSSTIHIAAPSPIVETIQTPINGWNGKRILVRPRSEILLSYKNEWSALALQSTVYFVLQLQWAWKTLCWVREARPKRPHLVIPFIWNGGRHANP